MRQAATLSSFECSRCRCKMSLNTVGTALTRALWTRGNRTPPFVRSPKVNRLSTTCRVSGERKQGREKTKEKSCGSCTDGPGDDVPTSSEPPHRYTAGDKKPPQEPPGAPGVTGVRRRSHTSTAALVDQKSYMWARYNDTKRLVHGKQRVPSLCVPHVQQRHNEPYVSSVSDVYVQQPFVMTRCLFIR